LRGYDSPQDARDNEEEEYDPAAPLNESADSVRAPDGRMAFQNEEPEPNDVASPLSSDDDDEDADFKGLIQLAKQNVSGQQQTPVQGEILFFINNGLVIAKNARVAEGQGHEGGETDTGQWRQHGLGNDFFN